MKKPENVFLSRKQLIRPRRGRHENNTMIEIYLGDQNYIVKADGIDSGKPILVSKWAAGVCLRSALFYCNKFNRENQCRVRFNRSPAAC